VPELLSPPRKRVFYVNNGGDEGCIPAASPSSRASARVPVALNARGRARLIHQEWGRVGSVPRNAAMSCKRGKNVRNKRVSLCTDERRKRCAPLVPPRAEFGFGRLISGAGKPEQIAMICRTLTPRADKSTLIASLIDRSTSPKMRLVRRKLELALRHFPLRSFP